jgi:hypothetical protein
VAGKCRNFWKYAAHKLTYISQIKTYFGKLREVFEEELMMVKILSHFPKIPFHLIRICLQRN